MAPQFPLLALFPRPVVVDLGDGGIVPAPKENFRDFSREGLRGTEGTVPGTLGHFALRRIEAF